MLFPTDLKCIDCGRELKIQETPGGNINLICIECPDVPEITKRADTWSKGWSLFSFATEQNKRLMSLTGD